MATDELSSKLNRRLLIEDGAAEPVAVDLASSGGGDQAPEDKPSTESADSELGAKLQRRGELNEGRGEVHMSKVFNPYTEFKEFSRKQIKDMEKMFKTFDAGKDDYIDMMELKLMMEKLGAPQTHLGLKNMMKEVDEDLDNKLNFKEFLMIFRKAAAGELAQDSGLEMLARLSEIDVSAEGVKGAKTFFEAKVQAINESNRFEAEIRQEQESKKQQAEEQKQRRAAFKLRTGSSKETGSSS
ncbi:EF-hand domain-containing protein D2 [Boleophthalmus pectinirostris]|uniref:EF-hand domain-containing protein D2 n=1 Tax=Boleophthalmus pectinirostris TaxID=150288 RepID=UPI00242AB3F8|nr:EF-hand domain-containing protein D2 [Boleophthalmus pectinirostris]